MIKNAKVLPQIYYGLHMCEGVAEYQDEGRSAYRIMINENTLKEMDPSFPGRPVFVRHVDEVVLDNIQAEADGWVIESFFNKADGKHWAKFIVVSDKGHEAIRSGWKLSNAYVPKTFSGGGLWHGVEFQKEVTRGEYEHLAIVPNPRYEESIILTPDQFKSYNFDKENELTRLANSKGESNMLFFKKTKVENSTDLEGMSVTLPKSKVEKTIVQLVNEADHMMEKEKSPQMANGDHRVKVGDQEMSVNDLVANYGKMCSDFSDLKKQHEGEDTPEEKMAKEAASKKNMDQLDPEAKKVDTDDDIEKKKNDDKAAEEKKKNDEAAKMFKKKENEAHFEALKNAPNTVIRDPIRVDLDKAARGKARYGSN